MYFAKSFEDRFIATWANTEIAQIRKYDSIQLDSTLLESFAFKGEKLGCTILSVVVRGQMIISAGNVEKRLVPRIWLKNSTVPCWMTLK